jgi:hypothetical protein
MDVQHHVFTFKATGESKDIDIIGGQPVRFSADGRYFVCRSNNSGENESLQVVAADTLARKKIGNFAYITFIRVLDNGSFNITAMGSDPNSLEWYRFATGLQYFPDSKELKTVWKMPVPNYREDRRTDFLIDPMDGIVTGVSTNYKLLTKLENLQTREALLTIDNGAGYQVSRIAYTVRGRAISVWFLVAAGVALVSLVGLLCFLYRWFRGSKHNDLQGPLIVPGPGKEEVRPSEAFFDPGPQRSIRQPRES